MKQAGNFMLPDSDTYFTPFLEAGGFQLDRLKLALNYVSEFDVAIDGGAHVGSWTCGMAALFDTVIAIEPAADTYQCLLKNIEGFDNVIEYNVALGASAGRGKIVDDVARHGNTGSRFMQIDSSGLIDFITLDSLELANLNFLKLDVEGFEYYSLLGGQETIQKFQPTVLVEEKGFGRRYNLQPFAASKLLESWGARCVANAGKDYVFVF